MATRKLLKQLSIAVASAGLATLGLGFTSSAQAANMVNGGFELPVQPSGVSFPSEGIVPGWQTTASDNKFEYWTSGTFGVPAAEGNQFAELNANFVSTLYQDVTGIAAGSDLGFTFFHRGRAGVDTLRLTITDLGLDGLFGTADDSKLFTNTYSTGNTAWVQYTNAGQAPITALGNNIRFAYESVSAAGGATVGNFLDGVDFGVGVGAPKSVPEPASTLALLAVGALGAGSLKRKQNKKANVKA